jgi:hypothetical protein
VGTELFEVLIQFGEKLAVEKENSPSWCLRAVRQGLMDELEPPSISERWWAGIMANLDKQNTRKKDCNNIPLLESLFFLPIFWGKRRLFSRAS